MNFNTTPISGLLVIEHKVWQDDRGYFIETYNEKPFRANGVDYTFVQDNLSSSKRGVVRGMHAQSGENAQGKLVRVLKGKALDVVVDFRKDSPTFGEKYSIELNGSDGISFWVPPGFLHGFIALEDDTLFTYKVTGFYDKSGELGMRWDDPDIAIEWPLPAADLIVSDKDKELPFFKDMESPF